MSLYRSHIVIVLIAICSLWGTMTHAQARDSVKVEIDSSRARHSVPSAHIDTVQISRDSVKVKQDTTKTKVRKKSSLNDTWYYGSEPNKRSIIDTSIFQLHRYDGVRGDGPESFNMGNTGTAAYPLVFNPAPGVGFNMGFHQFDAYHYQKDSVRYYQVIRPYAEIFYSLGITNEQVFRGRFANSHKNNFMYGVDFRRSNSKGTYNNQKAVDNGFNLYGIYNSKNKQLSFQTDLIYNAFAVGENGGLARDIIFKDSTLFQKTLAPVNLLSGQLNYKEINWFLKASYGIGKKYNERVNDTLVQRVVLPVFKVSYQFNLDYGKYNFFDLAQDSAYYSSYLHTGDTMRYSSRNIKVGNRFGVDYNAKKLTSDSTYQELNFVIGAAVNLDYHMISEFQQQSKFTNLYVTGYLKSNPAVNSRLLYKASVTYYMAGYNLNDLMAEGQVGLDLHKFGRLLAGAGYQLKQSDWVYHSFRADSSIGVHTITPNGSTFNGNLDSINFKYGNNFPKMSILRFGGEYIVDKIGIKVSAYNYVLKNYFYFSAPATPAYESNAINMLVLSFSNRFGIKGFHFDNDVWFQKAAGSDVIRLPLVTTKHSVYYERTVFKRALMFAIGVDLRYYTPFKANGYNPLTGQFYLQNDWQLKFYPVLDVFLNVKIKTVRVFLMGTNLSSFFGHQKGYYTSPLYPAADASFKFGAAWRFFE